jgi:hypothetical protein
VHLEFVAYAATYSVITALSYAGPSATITKAYAHLARSVKRFPFQGTRLPA